MVIAWFICISQKFLYWGLITEISVPPSTENFYETSLCHECIIQPRFVCTVKIIVKSKLTYFVDVWQAFVDMVLKNIEIRDWTREVILILWFQEYLCNSKFYQSTLITQKEIMQFWLGQFTNAKMCKCIFESIVDYMFCDFKPSLKFPLSQYPILIVHWICCILWQIMP